MPAGPHRSSRHSSPCVYPPYPPFPSSSPRPPQPAAPVPIVIDAQLPGLSPLPFCQCQLRTELVSSLIPSHPVQPAASSCSTPCSSASQRISRTERTQPDSQRLVYCCCCLPRRSQPPRCGAALLVVCLITYYYPLFFRLDSAQSPSSSLIATSRLSRSVERNETCRSSALLLSLLLLLVIPINSKTILHELPSRP